MEEEIQFDLHVVWNMPLHITRVESYVLFRKYLGKEDRGGTCSISVAETQEECADLGGEWTDSCSELSTDGDQVFETDNLTVTEFYDSVGLTGIWRYAVFAKHESGDLTLCTTNTFLAREIYTLTVISEHGDIFGNILLIIIKSPTIIIIFFINTICILMIKKNLACLGMFFTKFRIGFCSTSFSNLFDFFKLVRSFMITLSIRNN